MPFFSIGRGKKNFLKKVLTLKPAYDIIITERENILKQKRGIKNEKRVWFYRYDK